MTAIRLTFVVTAVVSIAAASCKVSVPVPSRPRAPQEQARTAPPPPEFEDPCVRRISRHAKPAPELRPAKALAVLNVDANIGTCALMDDRTVRCGDMYDGRLVKSPPVLLHEGVAQAAGGCVVLEDGTAECLLPQGCVMREPILDGADKLWALADHKANCGRVDGRIRCVGFKSSPFEHADAIAQEQDVSDIVMNELGLVVLTTGGALKIIYNNMGAKPAVELSGVREIAVGGDTFCALHNDGRISCWGETSNDRLPESKVHAIEGVEDVHGIRGGSHGFCGITSSHSLTCWANTQSTSDFKHKDANGPLNHHWQSVWFPTLFYALIDEEGGVWLRSKRQEAHTNMLTPDTRMNPVLLNSEPH